MGRLGVSVRQPAVKRDQGCPNGNSGKKQDPRNAERAENAVPLPDRAERSGKNRPQGELSALPIEKKDSRQVENDR